MREDRIHKENFVLGFHDFLDVSLIIKENIQLGRCLPAAFRRKTCKPPIVRLPPNYCELLNPSCGGTDCIYEAGVM